MTGQHLILVQNPLQFYDGLWNAWKGQEKPYEVEILKTIFNLSC